jgi:hypothetical protein
MLIATGFLFSFVQAVLEANGVKKLIEIVYDLLVEAI